MRPRLAIALLLCSCNFDASTSAVRDGSVSTRADADPNAPDADPNAPDADPSAPDAMACEGWALLPSFFNPCTEIEMVAADLTLDADGTYVFDTSDGSLILIAGMPPMGYTSQIVPTDSQDVTAPFALVAANITIGPLAKLRVIGPRPALLVAWENLTIDGRVDASSNRDLNRPVGAGANSALCAAATKGTDSDDGGAGGGGGGYGGKGGDGFHGGRSIATLGGIGGSVTSAGLRGGCPGAVGGTGNESAEVLDGGDGGGAVHIIARNVLTLSGTVEAGGDGGQRAGLKRAGGGGGGSGGYIGLEADEIKLSASARLAANGGGGGGGAKESPTDASPGNPGRPVALEAAGGEGEPDPFGNGGGGGFSILVDGLAGYIGDRGSGGGGGGVGYILLKTNQASYEVGATITPPATTP